MTILPLTYLPRIEHFAHIIKGECSIDLGEHYIKRSERNRAEILTSNNVMTLSVHLRNANRPRTPMRDIEIDYSKRWQHQHWGALTASYNHSPYFEYFAYLFEPFYKKEYRFLVDYNIELLELMCRLAQIEMPTISESYIEATDYDIDLRPKSKEGSTFCAEPYTQLFSNQDSFTPNLSFVDLLFAEGRGSKEVLKQCSL